MIETNKVEMVGILGNMSITFVEISDETAPHIGPYMEQEPILICRLSKLVPGSRYGLTLIDGNQQYNAMTSSVRVPRANV